MTRTLWFSYSLLPHMTLDTPAPINTPYAITWHVGRYLRERASERGWDFRYVQLDDTTPQTFADDDIALGHLWFNDGSFMQQALDAGLRAAFILQPYTHHMVGNEALPTLFRYFGRASHLFLITGSYWWDTLHRTDFAEWEDKATRLDNAVDPRVHVFSKRRWNKVGKRAVLTIGYRNPIKGLDRVGELARIAGFRLGHFGEACPEYFEHTPQYIHYGGRDFTPDVIQWICDEYDALICLGRYDANPTTLSEAACWGLLPFCNPQSGYWPDKPFVELKSDDLCFNLEQMDWLQHASEHELAARQAQIRQFVVENHTWDRACETVWEKMQEWL